MTATDYLTSYVGETRQLSIYDSSRAAAHTCGVSLQSSK